MNVQKKVTGLLTAGLLLALLAASTASAVDYPRPSGGTPIRVSLVPTYKECTSPNAAHIAPLSLPSCTAWQQTSTQLTTDTGASPTRDAYARIDVLNGDLCTTADEADVKLTGASNDIKKKSDGTLYNGKIVSTSQIRITDLSNPTPRTWTGCPPTPTGGTPGTVQDTQFSVPVQCVNGVCNTNTTADALVPGVVREGQRAIVETPTITILDAGPDGSVDPVSTPIPGLGCPPFCGEWRRNGIRTPGDLHPVSNTSPTTYRRSKRPRGHSSPGRLFF